MTLKDCPEWVKIMERVQASENAMKESFSRMLYADPWDAKKPSAWQAFKYRVVSKVKEAVRWATYWAWEDHI